MDGGIVVGTAGIRAPTEQGKVRWHAQFGQALRQCALPRRPDDREMTALAADRARAWRMRHVVPRVDDLHYPEPLPHVRHRKDHRFLRQIQLRHRVERVDVEAHYRPVRGVGKRSIVNELVDRGTGRVDLGHVRGRVDLDLDVDERHAKDPRLLRDGFRFVGRDGCPLFSTVLMTTSRIPVAV